MTLDIHIPIVIWILLLLMFVVAIIITLSYRRRYSTVIRQLKKQGNDPELLPDVSILVYCNDDSIHLRSLLPKLLTQQYNGFYEVIICDDSSSDAAKNLYTELSADHYNLFYTFVSHHTMHISRKKLAITLGIKSATYDIVLNTSSSVVPPDDQWLTRMMRNFDTQTDIVIGLSQPLAGAEQEKGGLFRSYDYIATVSEFISQAATGKPFRADGNNLAYRKDSFYQSDDFAKTSNFNFGDDDLLISKMATSSNTKIEISDGSILTRYSDNYAYDYDEDKLIHNFTRKLLHSPAIRKTQLMWAMNWIFLLLFIGLIVSAVICSGNIESMIVAFLMAFIVLLALWIVSASNYKRIASAFSLPTLSFRLPFYALSLPVNEFFYTMKNLKRKNINYT